MIKSYSLYAALTQLTPAHQQIQAWNRAAPFQPHFIYVRVEAHDCDYNEAMDRVKPMEGETFLNTVPA